MQQQNETKGNTKLSARQQLAIPVLIEEPYIRKAAERLGISQ